MGEGLATLALAVERFVGESTAAFHVPQVLRALALQVHVHLLRRRHPYRDRVPELRRLADLQSADQLRNLHLIPDAVVSLAVCLLGPVFMLRQELTQLLCGAYRVVADVPLSLLQLLGHGVPRAVRVPACHALHHVHRRELFLVEQAVQLLSLACRFACLRLCAKVQLFLAVRVDLCEQPVHVVVDDVVPVVELRPQSNGCLIQILQRVQIHVRDLLVVQAVNDLLQLFRRQEVRVVCLCVLIHLGQVFPRRVVLLGIAHLVGCAHCVDVQVSEHLVPGSLQFLRCPVLVLGQPLQRLQCLLLLLLQLAVLPLPLAHLLALLPFLRAAECFALPGGCRLLPLLCDLHAGSVSQMNLQLCCPRERAQCFVHLPLDIVQDFVFRNIFLPGQKRSVLRQAHVLALAFFRRLHNVLQNLPAVQIVRMEHPRQSVCKLCVDHVDTSCARIVYQHNACCKCLLPEIAPVVSELMLHALRHIDAAPRNLRPCLLQILIRCHFHDAFCIHPVEEGVPVFLRQLAVLEHPVCQPIDDLVDLCPPPFRNGEDALHILPQIPLCDDRQAFCYRLRLVLLARLFLLLLRLCRFSLRRLLDLAAGFRLRFVHGKAHTLQTSGDLHALLVVPGLVLDNVQARRLHLLQPFRRTIIRRNADRLVKCDHALRLRLEISRRHFCRLAVHTGNLRGKSAVDVIPLPAEGLLDAHGVLPGVLHEQARDLIHVVASGGLLYVCDNSLNALVQLLQQPVIFFFRHILQAALVCMDGVHAFVSRRRHR